jgi:N-acetylmuramoyl-L-alanine amidase
MKKAALPLALLILALGALGAGAQEKLSKPIDKPSGAPVAECLDKLHASLDWDPLSGGGQLRLGSRSISFYEGQDEVYFSNLSKKALRACFRQNGALYLTDAFVAEAAAYFSVPEEKPRFSIAAIVIDPGHGGKDPGTLSTQTVNGKKVRLVEKDITLEVSTRVAKLLGQAYPDKKIIMTRVGDSYPDLPERMKICNSIKLDKDEAGIYISIHANASLNKSGKGFEVWYLPPETRRHLVDKESQPDVDPVILPILNDMMDEEYTRESILLAKKILAGLDDKIGDRTKNRGTKENDWYVVKNAKMPSVLVELAHVTNQDDAELLSDPETLKAMADGVYNGILSFIRDFEQTKGFTE